MKRIVKEKFLQNRRFYDLLVHSPFDHFYEMTGSRKGGEEHD